MEKFGGVPYPPEVTDFTPSLPLDRRGQGYQSSEVENRCVASMWYTVEVVTASRCAKTTVAQSKPNKLQVEPGSIFLPLEMNGEDAEFFFDTGAGAPSWRIQKVVASTAEIQGDHLVLLDDLGKLRALFLLESVENWSEIAPLLTQEAQQ